MILRKATADGLPALLALYTLAFPDEDLRPLLYRLFATPGVVSLVAVSGETLLAHLAMTPCKPAGVLLLGPVAVAPGHQRQGLGRRIILAGCARMAARGAVQMQVLGDPAFYGRLGFQPDRALAPPYTLPPEWAEAWQMLRLIDAPALTGTMQVPPAWDDPALWRP
jgi:putative acetyltransferase